MCAILGVLESTQSAFACPSCSGEMCTGACYKHISFLSVSASSCVCVFFFLRHRFWLALLLCASRFLLLAGQVAACSMYVCSCLQNFSKRKYLIRRQSVLRTSRTAVEGAKTQGNCRRHKTSSRAAPGYKMAQTMPTRLFCV